MLEQGFPNFLWPHTPLAFRQMSMYPFSISKDKHVALKFLMTKYFIMINHRYTVFNNRHINLWEFWRLILLSL